MKNNNFKWFSMIVAIMMFSFITACNNAQQEQDGAEEGTEMGDGMNMEGMDMDQQGANTATADIQGEPAFLVDYIDIKNAMVNDNYEQAKQAASEMQNSLENSELDQQQRNRLKENAEKLAEAQNIESQRQAFHQLSQELYQVVQNNDVNNKTLYWQHCPMAMNNKGANWLSYQEQVQNPFMGQRMPKCGSVKETIQ